MLFFHSSFLKNFGLIEWSLRDLKLLKVNIPFTRYVSSVGFLIVSDVRVSLRYQFINDVLLSILLPVDYILSLTCDEVVKLPKSMIYCHCWWVGVLPSRKFNGLLLVTPCLSILQNSSQLKRDLWTRISYYNNFLCIFIFNVFYCFYFLN